MEGIINIFQQQTRQEEKAKAFESTRFGKELIKDIIEVKKQIQDAHTKFNMVSEDDLVEAAIYEERALKAKYSYLISIAKENNVCCEIICK